LSHAAGWAYPSGHTTQAVAGWGILALETVAGGRSRHRVPVVVAASVVAGLVGASRVYLGVHWLTDVLGGITLSGTLLAFWLALGSRSEGAVARRRPSVTISGSRRR
jgi:undecaprenyl-diphosphatase